MSGSDVVESVVEARREADALDDALREILDIVEGFSRRMTNEAKLEVIHTIASEACRRVLKRPA